MIALFLMIVSLAMGFELPPYSEHKLLIVGDVMLDRYWYGDTQRISPEAPVPVVQVKRVDERPGGAANVALNVAALGTQVSLLGLVGDDQSAETLLYQLHKENIHTQLHTVKGMPTVTKSRVIGLNQQLLRLDIEQKFAREQTLALTDDYTNLLANMDVVVLSDYGKGTLALAERLITLARHLDIPVLVDPKGRDFTKYKGATLITPNRKEFELVVGECNSQEQLVQRGMNLLDDLDLQALLITRGSEGMTLLSKQGEPLHLAAHAHEIFDVTGAGDTVIGVLAATVAAKQSLEQATKLANLAASISVTKLGAASVTPAQLQVAAQEQHTHTDTGIVNEIQLLELVRRAQADGERIVMTNGCFDLLHAGHVSYLQQAKALGDRLIVAVNTDDSVRKLKGEHRPINSLNERMQVVAGLGAVDWVVSFSEDTPERLIREVSPNVLVKGGDYQVHEIAGSAHVLAHHGSVKVLPFKAGCSSSNMIERIQAQVESVD